MDRWAGRVALVTGASMGIGAALCKELVKRGMKVVACARTESKLKALADELEGEKGEVHPFAMDVSKDEQVVAAFEFVKEKLGGVDVCVANAGMAVGGTILESFVGGTSPEEKPAATYRYKSLHDPILLLYFSLPIGGKPNDWRAQLDVNLTGTLHCAQLAIKGMLERGVDDGQVILIGSALGYQATKHPELHFYSLTKCALKASATALRRELLAKKSRIRVSNVSPGYVDTEFASRAIGIPSQAMRAKLNEISMEPLQVQDVVDAIIHTLSTPPRVQVHDLLFLPTDEDY
ncbi:hypothetical protein J437_LFUL009043 [Ladona fulva]|uniref:Uncharacterized protein n=1 Tax=Ladona fulva TaxID=123851 RepID=A0A8K0K5F1_LADFU|nr:hypothetical protein J437_LFUL009043 [Ladona fulva]